MPDDGMKAKDVIAALGLEPHPEGGHFRETYRAPVEAHERSAITSIYFLLRAGERSHWHRVDASELWYWHAGAPLRLRIADNDGAITDHTLGPGLAAGQHLQAVVPPHAWQAAESLGDWTLVGCAVGPGFDFSGFELAPEGWTP